MFGAKNRDPILSSWGRNKGFLRRERRWFVSDIRYSLLSKYDMLPLKPVHWVRYRRQSGKEASRIEATIANDG